MTCCHWGSCFVPGVLWTGTVTGRRTGIGWVPGQGARQVSSSCSSSLPANQISDTITVRNTSVPLIPANPRHIYCNHVAWVEQMVSVPFAPTSAPPWLELKCFNSGCNTHKCVFIREGNQQLYLFVKLVHCFSFSFLRLSNLIWLVEGTSFKMLLPSQIMMPALMVTAGKDPVLLPVFATGMEKLVRRLLLFFHYVNSAFTSCRNYHNHSLEIFTLRCWCLQTHKLLASKASVELLDKDMNCGNSDILQKRSMRLHVWCHSCVMSFS